MGFFCNFFNFCDFIEHNVKTSFQKGSDRDHDVEFISTAFDGLETFCLFDGEEGLGGGERSTYTRNLYVFID